MVLFEIAEGDTEASRNRLALAEQIPSLSVTPECSRVAQHLMQVSGLPETAARDAVHIAAAAVHGMEFLLTWNCRHIANAVLIPKLGAALDQLGYPSPMICTPQQLRRKGFAHEE